MTTEIVVDVDDVPIIRDCLQRRANELSKRLWNSGRDSPRNRTMRAERKHIAELIGKLPEPE